MSISNEDLQKMIDGYLQPQKSQNFAKFDFLADLAEFKQDLQRIDECLNNLSDTTACKISICLGDGKWIEYSVDNNKNLVKLLKSERKYIEDSINKTNELISQFSKD